MSDLDRSVDLPLDYGPLIGRSTEEQAAVTLLSRSRLISLTGTGGVGKTRLAIRVASRVAESMPGGAWLVELAALPPHTTVDQLWTSIARGIHLFNHQSGPDVVARHLDGPSALLVLDNCEHLLAPVREAVSALLAAAPNVRILATSRQPLHLPEAGEHVLDLSPLASDDAVHAFLAYARTIRSSSPGAADAETSHPGPQGATGLDPRQVSRLVEAVDRLPVALELTSRWVETMGLDELIAAVTADPWQTVVDLEAGNGRHGTLRRVYDWSWELCSDEERLAWQWISVFPRATEQPTIVEVCAASGLDRMAIARAVAGLRDKRILAADLDHTGTPRLGLLATARAYGAEHLDASGHAPSARAAYRTYYHTMLAHAADTSPTPDELANLRGVDAQLDHIKTAIDYAIADADLPAARTLVIDLTRTRAAFLCGWLGDARAIADRVIDAAGPDTVATSDEALQLAAVMAADAWITLSQGSPERARSLIADCHQLHKQWELEPSPPLQFAEGAVLALTQPEPVPRAVELLTAARHAFAGDPALLGDRLMVTMVWSMAISVNDAPRAEEASATFLAEAHAAGAPWTESWAEWDTTLAAFVDGRYDEANRRCRRALILMSSIGDVWGLTWALLLAAAICAASIDPTHPDKRQAKRAAWLAAAAQRRRDDIGVRLDGLAPLESLHTEILDRAAEVLDQRTFDRAVAEGHRRHHHAVQYALNDRLPRRPSPTDTLTRRQQEVAHLMLPDPTGHRRSDRDIAAELGIGIRTVETHVGNVLRVCGLQKRTELQPHHLNPTPHPTRNRTNSPGQGPAPDAGS
ncbi:ATP-binding protein [Actinocatenispora comari]|uniref:HTH luxR-type domain-containing protein n=1 Tax=Actinocatenispora comari TaxID=2807577 RepID=A0A8J4ALM5_9ACTN|nr:hypothetical protein [Actinocatenispora comari]GIL32067.1 hypothetical protein NUM_73210 [Actinocatenispora comari]